MKKSVKILIAILIIAIVGLVGFIIWDKVINKPKTNETTNTTNVTETNVVTNSTENTNTANTVNTTNITNTPENTTTSETKQIIVKSTTPSKLVVSREGMQDEVPSKEYSSTYGYTIRYATDNFKASNHDDRDWFDRDEDINCVAVDRENVSYTKKLESLSNYTKTKVNGYEAVYTTRKVEGQEETTYYINTGSEYTYVITKSCQDSVEYLEGLGHIMDAMIQTFAVK